MSAITPNQLSLAPLGAGDLIDRAVRLYRRHLFVLIRTAAPPVIVVAAGGIMLSISWRRIFASFTAAVVGWEMAIFVFIVGAVALASVAPTWFATTIGVIGSLVATALA